MMLPDSLKFTGKDKAIRGNEKFALLRAIELKYNLQKKYNERAKQEFGATIPNLFVGSYGYPYVDAGFLSNDNELDAENIKNLDYSNSDNPLVWSKEGQSKYSILKIIELRSRLVNSKFNVSVKNNQIGFNQRFADSLKEISLASKVIDAEINLVQVL